MTDLWDRYTHLNRWMLKEFFGIDEAAKNAAEMERKMIELRLKMYKAKREQLLAEQQEIAQKLTQNEFKIRVAKTMLGLGEITK